MHRQSSIAQQKHKDRHMDGGSVCAITTANYKWTKQWQRELLCSERTTMAVKCDRHRSAMTRRPKIKSDRRNKTIKGNNNGNRKIKPASSVINKPTLAFQRTAHRHTRRIHHHHCPFIEHLNTKKIPKLSMGNRESQRHRINILRPSINYNWNHWRVGWREKSPISPCQMSNQPIHADSMLEIGSFGRVEIN